MESFVSQLLILNESPLNSGGLFKFDEDGSKTKIEANFESPGQLFTASGNILILLHSLSDSVKILSLENGTFHFQSQIKGLNYSTIKQTLIYSGDS